MRTVRQRIAIFIAIFSVSMFGFTMLPPNSSPIGPENAFAAVSVTSMGAAYNTEVIKWINYYRAQNGKGALTANSCLSTKLAQPWSKYLAANNEFKHRTIDAMRKACPGSYYGETLAYGRNYTAKQIVQLWMGSSGHKAILLSTCSGCSWKYVGVGAYKQPDGDVYVAANFAKVLN